MVASAKVELKNSRHSWSPQQRRRRYTFVVWPNLELNCVFLCFCPSSSLVLAWSTCIEVYKALQGLETCFSCLSPFSSYSQLSSPVIFSTTLFFWFVFSHVMILPFYLGNISSLSSTYFFFCPFFNTRDAFFPFCLHCTCLWFFLCFISTVHLWFMYIIDAAAHNSHLLKWSYSLINFSYEINILFCTNIYYENGLIWFTVGLSSFKFESYKNS